MTTRKFFPPEVEELFPPLERVHSLERKIDIIGRGTRTMQQQFPRRCIITITPQESTIREGEGVVYLSGPNHLTQALATDPNSYFFEGEKGVYRIGNPA